MSRKKILIIDDDPDIVDFMEGFLEDKYKIRIWKRAYAAGNLIGYNKFYEFKYNEILSILEQECKIFEKERVTFLPRSQNITRNYFVW